MRQDSWTPRHEAHVRHNRRAAIGALMLSLPAAIGLYTAYDVEVQDGYMVRAVGTGAEQLGEQAIQLVDEAAKWVADETGLSNS